MLFRLNLHKPRMLAKMGFSKDPHYLSWTWRGLYSPLCLGQVSDSSENVRVQHQNVLSSMQPYSNFKPYHCLAVFNVSRCHFDFKIYLNLTATVDKAWVLFQMQTGLISLRSTGGTKVKVHWPNKGSEKNRPVWNKIMTTSNISAYTRMSSMYLYKTSSSKNLPN